MNTGGGDTLSTLGEYLRLEREKRGVTLEQVAASTKIGLRFLQLLEADQYSELPARPFIRGFVIAYCRYLGVDARETLQRYWDFLEAQTPAVDSRSENATYDDGAAERSRRKLWILMAVFLTSGMVVLLALKPKLKHRRVQHLEAIALATPSPSSVQSPTPSASPSAVAAKAAAAPTPTPAATPVPTVVAAPAPVATAPSGTSVEPNRKPQETDPLNKGDTLPAEQILLKVAVKTAQDAWIRFRVDERPQNIILLRAGSMVVMRAQSLIRFEVADPGPMTLRENNGGSRPLAGVSGAVNKGTHQAWVFPASMRGSIGDPFPGSKPLPAVPPPVPQPDTPPAETP